MAKSMWQRFTFLIVCIQSILVVQCFAQVGNYHAFTVNDGLPSNYVYRAVEDDKGYLWVATDAGIARFDGKHFQIFTTEQGLPDNEVLAVVKEKNGRIWVNCFKQKPVYFDEIQNRFINSNKDTGLKKIKEGTSNMHFFPLETGGVMFVNERGSTIIKNNQLFEYASGNRDEDFLLNKNDTVGNLVQGYSKIDTAHKTRNMILYQVKAGSYLDSLVLRKNDLMDHHARGYNDGKFYLFFYARAKCYIYSDFNLQKKQFKVDSVSIPESYNNFEFTPTSFYLMGNSGKIYLINKQTLEKEVVIGGDFLPNSLFNDSKGNLWLSTIDKGLLLYKKKMIGSVRLPDKFENKNFLSIARKVDGTIYAGNFYGQIVEIKGEKFNIHEIPKDGKIARQRKLILSQNHLYSFSEAGIFKNFQKFTGHLSRNASYYGKTAFEYNDSIILVGQTTNLAKLNTIKESVTYLNGMGKRITAITKAENGAVYFGSTDGLYQYDLQKDRSNWLANVDPILSERITSICGTVDSLIWVATSGNGIVVLKDNKVISKITIKEGLINNATRCIIAAKTGQVWLGTSSGISLLNYKIVKNQLHYDIQNLTINDGLTNHVINEMVCQNDSVFVATGEGISVVPVNISIPSFNMPVLVQRITVNQRDTSISNYYALTYQQRKIQIQMAGVELSGHFKKLEYNLDDNSTWTEIAENTLTLELSTGTHLLQVRAVDVNGNISNQILKLQFDIATPFWLSYWFWILIIVVIQGLVIYYFGRVQRKRKELQLAKKIASVQTASLEQQAFTSLMNPHFIFNALNSIQHYINLQDRKSANRYLSDFASLIRKNFEAAQQFFIPLEYELENIRIYLRLEQMRFSDRFSYRIEIEEHIDIEKWMIPTMMLQPLLENALIHGIIPSNIKGEILLRISADEHALEIMIQDNGIGMENSMRLKQNRQHKSHGMLLIRKRIAALNHFGLADITMMVAPAFENLQNTGNRITLNIPKGLYQAWLLAKQA